MKVNVCLPGNHLEAIVRNYVQLLYYSLSDLGHTVAISSNYIDSSMFNIIFDPLYAVQSQRDYFEALMKSDVHYGFQSVEMFTGNGFGYHHFPFTGEELGFLAALLERSKFVWTAFRDEFDCYRQITNKVQYIRYGYHEKMEEVCRSREKLIDVFFFGSPDAAGRSELLDGLRTAGLGVVVQPTGGSLLTRNSLIGASRINLNLSHHFPYRHASPNRLAFLANNGICAVSTPAVDPDGYLDHARVFPAEELVEGCRDWIAGARWESEGERVHALIRRHPMRDILGQALEEAFAPTS